MNYQSIPLLSGTLVQLEQLDIERHFSGLAKVAFDPGLWRYVPDAVLSLSDLQEYLDEALRLRARGLAVPFVLINKLDGRIVGSTRYGNIVPPDRRLEIGWTWLAKPYQKTGINVEAKLLLLGYAFEVANYNRVEFKTDSLNTLSREALKKLGAVEEGILRSHMVMPDGRLRHTVYYSIVKEEWPTVRPHLEARLAAHTNTSVAGH